MNILSSFLDGFTGGSIFAATSRPGAPTQVFADEGSDSPQAELVASLLKSENLIDGVSGCSLI